MNRRAGKITMKLMIGWGAKSAVFALAMTLLCMIPAAGSGAPQRETYTVVIDAAHGGDDPGVVSEKIAEKDLTLNLALLVREEAQKIGGLRIELTRSTDRNLSIAERAAAIGAIKADVLLSLHVNAGFGKKASGYEVYFPGFRATVPDGEGSSPIIKDMVRNSSLNDSVRLAQRIQSALETVFPRKGRGLRDAPSPLLDGLIIPGLTVEIGFATDPDDRKRLTEERTQRMVARALLKGLKDYARKGP